MVCRSWCRTSRAQIRREWPSTRENSHTMRLTPWLVRERNLEAGQVDLSLLAGRGLEPTLDGGGWGGPDHRDASLDGRIGPREAALLQLPPQPHGRQPRVGAEALAKIRDKGVR